MNLTCIAVDDEPAALGILSVYMDKTPFLEPRGTFLNPLEAAEFLNNETIDLIFLDINMPDLSGLELLRSMQKPPLVVFTTAHGEYALDGFQLDAVGYLLKPITFALFLKAANKARDLLTVRNDRHEPTPESLPAVPDKAGFLFVRVDQKMVRLDFSDIVMIEGNRDYITIYTARGRKLLTLQTLTQILEKLPSNCFARVHRSFIVNLARCDALDKHHIQLGNYQAPIGKSYRDAVFTRLEDYM